MKFKVISLNIWLGGMLFDSAIDFLKKENPDILNLQEVYNGKAPNLEKRFRTFDVLKSELKYSYGSFAPSHIEEVKEGGGEMIGWGNAIFSRFPIIAQKTVFYDTPFSANYIKPVSDHSYQPRNLQQAVLEIENNELNVFNTHGIWGFDGKDNDRRLRMGKTIANEIKNKENVILTGDFNISPDTKTIAGIEKHLKNVFKNELTTSFNMKHKKEDSGYATAVADMIFVSKNIKILEHYCPEADVSDHLPLVCVLETCG